MSVLALAALATIALALAPAASARTVAVATGASTDDRGRTSWTLRGRRLTVRLPSPVRPGARAVTVRAACGDDVATLLDSPLWASFTGGKARVAGRTRVVSVVLGRDLAGVANRCALSWSGGKRARARSLRAGMKIRHGRVTGCRRGSREQVLVAAPTVRVTVVRRDDRVGFRACRRPDGTPRTVETGGSSGGGGGSTVDAHGFVAAGTWLAWLRTVRPHDGSASVDSAVRLVDMATRGAAADIDSGFGIARSLAVSATGSVAWLLEPVTRLALNPPRMTADGAQLRARRLGGAVVVLDRTEPVVCWTREPPALPPADGECHSGAAITDIAVADRTIGWRHAGEARIAALP